MSSPGQNSSIVHPGTVFVCCAGVLIQAGTPATPFCEQGFQTLLAYYSPGHENYLCS